MGARFRLAVRASASRSRPRRPGRVLGGLLQRSVRAAPSPIAWELTHGPEFANDMALITIDGPSVELLMEQARPDTAGQAILSEVIRTSL